MLDQSDRMYDHSNKHQPSNKRVLTGSGTHWTNQITCMIIATSTSPETKRVLEWWIAGMAHHGVVEINREGFVEVIELDPSSLLVSDPPLPVRVGYARLLVLVYVATCAYDSEAWSELQLASCDY